MTTKRHMRKRNGAAGLLDRSHFRRLGLSPRECRLDRIRAAALQEATQVHESSKRWRRDRVDSQLALIAWSTYRLTDPRQRGCDWERIQLAFPLEREEYEIPELESLAILKSPASKVGDTSLVDSLTSESHDPDQERICRELVEMVDSAVESVHDDSLEERREVVRLLRSIENPEKDLEGPKHSTSPWWMFGGTGLLLIFTFLGSSWNNLHRPSAPHHADNTADRDRSSPSNGIGSTTSIPLGSRPSSSTLPRV